MAGHDPKLFRAAALEQISSPDNLERLTPVVNSADWVTLAVVALIFSLAIAWCLFGSLPTVVNGRGILLQARADAGALESVAYVPVRDGTKIKPGMAIQIVPDNVERERFGGILGVVTAVSPIPVTRHDVAYRIGNAEVAQTLAGDGTFVEVRAKLMFDRTTYSGYKWSSGKGPELKMPPGLTDQIRVVVERRRPVSYLIPILRDASGT